MAFLEQDITWRDGLANVEYPSGSGMTYTVVVTDGAAGTVVVNSTGSAGTFSRNLQITLKMGG
jgi:hypothetical protein